MITSKKRMRPRKLNSIRAGKRSLMKRYRPLLFYFEGPSSARRLYLDMRAEEKQKVRKEVEEQLTSP